MIQHFPSCIGRLKEVGWLAARSMDQGGVPVTQIRSLQAIVMAQGDAGLCAGLGNRQLSVRQQPQDVCFLAFLCVHGRLSFTGRAFVLDSSQIGPSNDISTEISPSYFHRGVTTRNRHDTITLDFPSAPI